MSVRNDMIEEENPVQASAEQPTQADKDTPEKVNTEEVTQRDNNTEQPDDEASEQEKAPVSVVINRNSDDEDEPKKRMLPFILVIVLLLGVIAFLCWFIITGMLSKDDGSEGKSEMESTDTDSRSESSLYEENNANVSEDSENGSSEGIESGEDIENSEGVDEGEDEYDVVSEALSLIDEGDIDAAYQLLYGAREDERAESMLKKFLVLPGKVTTKQEEREEVISYIFDTKGNMISKTVSDIENGVIYGSSTVTTTFDDDGKLLTYTEIETPNGVGDTRTVTQYENTYDSNGRIIKSWRPHGFYTDTMLGLTEYNYNANGILVSEKTTYDSRVSREYRYDDDGNILYSFDIMDGTTEYVRGEDGRLLSSTFTGMAHTGDKKRETTYTYNSSGEIYKEYETVKDENGTVVRTSESTYEYTSGVLTSIVKITTYSDGTKRTDEYKYDSHGNILKGNGFNREIVYESDGSVTVNEYDNNNKLHYRKYYADEAAFEAGIKYKYTEYDSEGEFEIVVIRDVDGTELCEVFHHEMFDIEYDSCGNVKKVAYGALAYEYSDFYYYYVG